MEVLVKLVLDFKTNNASPKIVPLRVEEKYRNMMNSKLDLIEKVTFNVVLHLTGRLTCWSQKENENDSAKSIYRF